MRAGAVMEFEFDKNLLLEWDRYCGCEDRRGDANVLDVANIPFAEAFYPRSPDGLYEIVTMSVEQKASIEDKDVLGVVNVAEFLGYGWVDTEQCIGPVWIGSASNVDVAVDFAVSIDLVADFSRHVEETQAFRNGVGW
jgi:hypothetical protein